MREARLAPRPTTEAVPPGGGPAVPARGRLGPVAQIGLFRAFWNFMRDPNATLAGKSFIVMVFLYVVSPIDLVPELFVPWFGWLDDLGMAAIAAAYLSSALGPYRTKPAPELLAASTKPLPPMPFTHRGGPRESRLPAPPGRKPWAAMAKVGSAANSGTTCGFSRPVRAPSELSRAGHGRFHCPRFSNRVALPRASA